MVLDLKNLTLDDKRIYDKYACAQSGFLGWEYNFAMTYVWNALFTETKIFDAGDMAFLCTKFYDTCVFYPPMLLDPKKLPEAVALIEKQASFCGSKLDLRGLTKEQADLLDPEKYEITTDRANSDYIYNTADLIGLPGKNYHSKRNFVSRFDKNYRYTFRVYDPATDRAAIWDLYKKWNNGRGESPEPEDRVIVCALDFYKELSLDIGVLEAEGKIAAFSVSSVDNPVVAHTMFEKADTAFDGAYQKINQMTAEKFFSNVPLVNRQEDMGIEGLRKAKLSYHPVQLLDKYWVKLKK